MGASVSARAVATEGNEVSTSFQPGDKRIAVDCWQRAIEAAGFDDKFIAGECGVSRGYYSKIASGQQGDLMELAYRLPPTRAYIRADFFRRLVETELLDPIEYAAEQMAASAIRFLRIRASVAKPRMAKASIR